MTHHRDNPSRFRRTRAKATSALIAVIAASIALLAAAPAFAQDAPSNAPRQPAVTNLGSAWVGYLAMALVGALVLAISLRGSARGQQKE